MSMPLIRVCAVNGTKVAFISCSSRPRMPKLFASTTIERPSGVSSASEASCAASASSCSVTPPGAGQNFAAWRLPSVIVPVLSSSSTSTSPAASIARPDVATTLAWIMRSMPAMPIADSSPPIVVGIRQTSRATSTVSPITCP